MRDINRAIELNTDCGKFWWQRAIILSEFNDAETTNTRLAIADLYVAEQRGIDSYDLFRFRGELYFKVSEWKKAINDMDTAIAASSGDLPRAIKFRGRAYLKLEVYDRAENDFTRLIELGVDRPRMLLFRALTRCAQGKVEQTIDDFAMAAEINPEIIREWQHILVKRGHYSGPFNGHFDSLTQAATLSNLLNCDFPTLPPQPG